MLVTLDDTKNYLSIPLVDTTYDAFLTEQIELLSDTVEVYCRRKFLANDYVQTIYMDEVKELNEVDYSLKTFYYPLNSVASLTVDGEVLDPSEYRINSNGFITRANKQKWIFTAYENIVVSFNAGYPSTPPIIKSVIYTLISERYNKKKSNIGLDFGSDVQRVSIPGVMSLDFDYTLQSNDRKSTLGMILGNWANSLDYYRSERAVIGTVENNYVV